MRNRDRIPARMREVMEDARLTEWSDRDAACRNFPNCLGGEPCNSECDHADKSGDGRQWGDP